MPVQAADLSFVGISKETVEGTFVASSAYLPVKKIDFKPMQEYKNVEVMQGSMGTDFGRVPTFNWGEIDLGGPVYADAIAWIIAGLHGDVTDSGVSAPFTHAFALKNSTNGQPTTHSVNDFYSAANRGVSGVKWTELDIKWSADGLLEYDAKGTGISQAVQTKPVSSFTTVLPSSAWQGVLTIGGVSNTLSMNGDIKFSRKHELLKVMNGTQTPLTCWVSTLAVSGKYSLLMNDDTELTRYLTNTQPTLNINFLQGSGATIAQVMFNVTKAAYTKPVKIKQEPGKPVIIEAEWEGILNTTDAGASGGYSPCKTTIQNATAAGLYL